VQVGLFFNDTGMIYETHFSLTQRPFTIAPNPLFLYANGQYQEALAALEYGLLHRGGFVLLTGEVGTGKTTLCKYILANIPSNTEVALVLHPQLDRLEMLQLICREFKIIINITDTEVSLIERLTEFLLKVYSKGGYSVLIIDEAQHLDRQVLELIRLLTNLETHEDKLLQIILLGQPELKARLQQYDMRQLNQRFTARYHLTALNYSQLGKYVNHRLTVAGRSQKIFSTSALLVLYKLSGGIPRLVNIIADRSLMGGYALGKNQISPWIVYQAAKEVIPSTSSFSYKSILTYLLVFGLALFASMMLVNNKSINNFDLISNAGDSIKSSYQQIIKSTANTTALNNTENCGPSGICWQGRLPAELLLPDQSLNIFLNRQWINWAKIDQSSVSGLVLVQLAEPINNRDVTIKAGQSNQLIPWVKGILQHPDALKVSVDIEFSEWQVIKPDSVNIDQDNRSSLIYDDFLEMQVQAFQRHYGLLVDGIIGLQTLISLELLENKLAKI
jgi:type II secretory pathway predicted ATPase ExeA